MAVRGRGKRSREGVERPREKPSARRERPGEREEEMPKGIGWEVVLVERRGQGGELRRRVRE